MKTKTENKQKINNKKDKKNFIVEHKLIALIILAFILIMSFHTITGYRVPILDEGIYIGMGKHLYTNGDSGFWERFRPLGVPIISGLGWKLGFDEYSFSRFISILFSAGSILLIYLITNKIFDKKTALISSLLLIATPLFFYYSDYVLTEIPSMFFILTGIYALLYDKYLLAGIMGGLGFFFKFTQGLFFIAIAIFIIIMFFNDIKKQFNEKKILNINKKHSTQDNSKDELKVRKAKNKTSSQKISKINNKKTSSKIILNNLLKTAKISTAIIAGFLIILLPYLLFNYLEYKDSSSSIYESTIYPVISATIFQDNQYQNLIITSFADNVYNYLYYLINLFANSTFTSPILIFFLVGIYFFFKEKMYTKKEHILLALIFITFLIYFTSIPYKQIRFVYFFVPIAIIYTSYALIKTYNYMSKKSKFTHVLIILFIVLTSSIAIIDETSFHSWKYKSKPDIVTNFYEYYEANNISGIIATGDMVLAAYTDNPLTNLWELRAYIEGINSNEISAVFHAEYTYPCLDDACIKDRTEFFENVSSRYDLIKKDACYSDFCYIYVKKP